MGGQGCEDRAGLENGTEGQAWGDRMELGAEPGAGDIQSWERAKVEGRIVREGAGAAGNIRS